MLQLLKISILLREVEVTLEELQVSRSFIASIRTATLDEGGLDEDVLERLKQDPIKQLVDFADDSELRTSISLFLNTTTASQAIFENVCQTVQRHME